MSSTYQPLVAMCHPRTARAGEAVKRIRAGESRYDEELDRLCDQLGERPENVRPTLDRIMQDTDRRPDETTGE
jgi:hypothetical protein